VCLPMSRLLALLVTLSFSAASAANAGGIEWNGFGSSYYGQEFNANVLPAGIADAQPAFAPYSLIGLNIGAKISNQWSVVSQLVANGQSNLDGQSTWWSFIKWAFIAYDPLPYLNVRAGRQIIPTFIASQFAEVGFLLPYRRIPPIVYGLAPDAGFDGLWIAYHYATHLGTLQWVIYGGRPNIDVGAGTNAAPLPTLQSTVSNMLGSDLSLEGGDFGVHLNVTRASVFSNGTIDSLPLQSNSDVTFFSAGYRYDRNRIVSWAEYLFYSSSNGLQFPIQDPALGLGGRVLARGRGGYFLLGYRFARFLPRYAFSASTNEGGFTNGSAVVHDFGINFQVHDQIVLKLDYELQEIPSIPEPASFVLQRRNGSPDTTGNALFAGLDFIF
jgi:hypothetical protein